MQRSIAATTTLALAAASTILIASPAQAAIVDFYVYHSLSYTQDASGLSAPVASVQATILTDVKGEFDGGSVPSRPTSATPSRARPARPAWSIVPITIPMSRRT